ncbi:MAG: 6-hydroxymethylpterin diphosphokinase MptE-like protein [Treponema sp.]|nr:6-hydroxymethylpterin diphosphokinase MptE-like protein [Treponema sp.]
MNSIWNNNIEAFKSRFPALYEIYAEVIKNQPANDEINCIWKIETAKNGQITASENNIRLHSTYNPQREAFQAISGCSLKEKSAAVFYGFGLGYQVIEFAKNENLKSKKLILIEPDVFHFFAALSLLDWTEVFKVENLIIALSCPSDQIISLLEDQSKINTDNSGVSDTYFFDFPAFQKHAEKYFFEIKQIVERNKKKNEINAATLKKFGKLWERNSLKNFDQMKKCRFVSSMKNQITDKPFLVVGAGPSLEKIIPVLKTSKNHYVIVCVETALHFLLKNNIQPDFIILLDSQFWAYRHIEGLKAPESILITDICACPAVFRFPCKEILLCSSPFHIGKDYETANKLDMGDLGTGGSVACSAWNFAVYCGAKEIFLAGVDLGFPQKQTHIKGSSAEQTWHTVSNRTSTAEKNGISALYSTLSQKSTNYNNEEIITDSRMKMFAWYLESRIASNPGIKTYTLCNESMKIPGVEIIHN